jgi:hypothetical protein
MREETALCATETATVKDTRLPARLCPACGVCDVPTIGPGTGQHAAWALCRQCGRFLQWLPHALVAGKDRMPPLLNKVMLIGTIGKYGVEVRYSQSGTPCASFALQLNEQGQDGKVHATNLATIDSVG